MNACGGAVLPVEVNMAARVCYETRELERAARAGDASQWECAVKGRASRHENRQDKVGMLIDVIPPLAWQPGPSSEVCFAFLAISMMQRDLQMQSLSQHALMLK